MAGKLDLKQLFERADAVAVVGAASELFGLLTRSVSLPAQWGALVTKETGDQVMVPAGATVDGHDAHEVFFVRTSPLDVRVEEDGLVTKDGMACRAEGRCHVRVIPERAELLSFRRTILGSERTSLSADLADYLTPALRSALKQVTSEHEAKLLVDGTCSDAVSKALAVALEGPCFSAGLAISAKPVVQFSSQALERVRQVRTEAVRRQREHEASRELRQALELAQREHLDHLASLLSRLREMTDASPDVELGDLIRTFSEKQRGEVYEALFASEPVGKRTRWVVVAAGGEVLFFDPQSPDAPTRRVPVAGSAGGVRSIQTVTDADGQRTLLLGAATGVYQLGIEKAEPDVTLVVEDAPPVRGGFNAATLIGDRVLATHSELGLREWHVDKPTAARTRFESITRKAKAVRNVMLFEGDLYCSIDDRILRWPANDDADRPTHFYTGARAMITALQPTPGGLYAGTSEGDVLRWIEGRDTEPEQVHAGSRRPAESLWLLVSHGIRRLVFTDTSARVHARVLGDSFTCHYEAGGQTLPRVEVAPDLWVATNDVRDRLICWKPGEPAKPFMTTNVHRICQSHIQDVCLVPEV